MTNVVPRRQTDGLDELLHEVRRQTARGTESGARRILDWLCRRIDAQVALVEDAATAGVRTADFPERVLRPVAPLLGRVSGGQLATATTQAETLHVHCAAVGNEQPCPVLVVVGDAKPDPEAVSLIAHVGSVLTLLRRADAGGHALRGYQHKAQQIRLGVLHALLAGDPMLARRMNSGAVPPLLDAGSLRVFLLSCPPADRDRIAQAHQDASGFHGRDLMVRCPVFNEHLICLVAEEENGDPTGGVGSILRRLIRDNPRYVLGISGVYQLDATAQAYSESAHALSAARAAPERVAYFHGRSSLGTVLPSRPALDWARAFLRELESVPRTSIDVTRMSMNMPRSGVARLFGLSRNTVAAHLGRTERALGLRLSDVRSRAAVHLALALGGSRLGSEADAGQPPPTLDELRRTVPALIWAESVLRPLDVRHRRTLQNWIDANANAQRAAHRLDISRNTVRTHLLTVEGTLGIDLLTTGNGIHDIVHALDISTGRAL